MHEAKEPKCRFDRAANWLEVCREDLGNRDDYATSRRSGCVTSARQTRGYKLPGRSHRRPL